MLSPRRSGAKLVCWGTGVQFDRKPIPICYCFCSCSCVRVTLYCCPDDQICGPVHALRYFLRYWALCLCIHGSDPSQITGTWLIKFRCLWSDRRFAMIENDLLESIIIIMNNITIIVMKCNMLYVTNFFVFFITLVKISTCVLASNLKHKNKVML